VNAKACSDRKKLSSTGFKPSQSEGNRFWFCCGNDMAKTSWMDSEGNHLWVNVIEGTYGWKKNWHRQVSDLRSPRETDFDSVVTTWLRPVRLTSKEISYEWMPRHVLLEKYCRRRVSNLRSPRETDFDSVVVTTWLRPVKMSLRGNHSCVNVIEGTYGWKKLVGGRFQTCEVQEEQIFILSGKPLSWHQLGCKHPTKRWVSECQGVFR